MITTKKNPTAIDLYNMTETGGVTKTLNSAATDSDHVPCVVIPIEGNGSRQSHQGKGYGEIGGGNVYTQYNRDSCGGNRKEDQQWNR